MQRAPYKLDDAYFYKAPSPKTKARRIGSIQNSLSFYLSMFLKDWSYLYLIRKSITNESMRN